MTTLPQGHLPQDPGILRTVAHQNLLDLGKFGRSACLGVYADVVKPGVVRRGDTVRVLD
jgi:MOSC domain-containing protein YiiM